MKMYLFELDFMVESILIAMEWKMAFCVRMGIG
jgi:hypothetical protein